MKGKNTVIASVLATLLVLVGAVDAAHAGPTRTRLWDAMHAYASCRVHSPRARFAGDISAADMGPRGSRVTYETLMTNKAALVVNAGHQRHRVRWITCHGVVQRLFTFRRLRNVARRLDEACSA